MNTNTNTITADGTLYNIDNVVSASRQEIEATYPNLAAASPALVSIYTVSKPKGRKYYTMDIYKSGRIDVY